MKDINLIEFLQQPEPEFPTLAWRFAKTMASSPHAYVVRSLQNEDEYAKFSLLIAREGVWEEWKDGRRYRYLTIGPFKYWEMDPVINRAKA
jgi:hypothetical protein